MTEPTQNPEGVKQTRTKCEIYTRVMGYYRPVSQFNIGKKSEFYSRTYFKEHISQAPTTMPKHDSLFVSCEE